jgi:hypothetical protein
VRNLVVSKLEILGTRELTTADLARPRRPQPPTIARLRDIHHMMARMFATGMALRTVAALTGYSYERVCMLRRSPQMDQLVAEYRASGELTEATLGPLDMAMALATKAKLTALRHIVAAQEDADDAGEYLPVRQSLSIFAETGDRVGFGKRSTTVNVNVDFAAQLERAIRRSGEAKVIEAKVA